MNEVMKAILERRSVRKYTEEPVSREDLDQIVEAGLWAASGRNRQDVIILAVTDKELRDRLSRANCEIGGWTESADPFFGAPAVLVVLADKQCPNHVYDGSLVIGNMMLAAHSLGLGSCWIHRARQVFEAEEFKQLLRDLGIQGDWEGIGHCIVGHPAGDPPRVPHRKPDRVFWVE